MADQLTFNGGRLVTTSTLSLDVNRGVTVQGYGGTIAPAVNTTLTVAGVVAGTGLLTVNGAGTLYLTGTNTYSGGTSISGGIVQINGAPQASVPSAAPRR